MSDNSDSFRTTFETASMCPKCGFIGEDRGTSPGPKKSTIHHIYCGNARCKWYNTPYLVQVNEDGSIPKPTNHTGEKKVYEGFEGHDERARELIDILKRNAQAEIKPCGAEI